MYPCLLRMALDYLSIPGRCIFYLESIFNPSQCSLLTLATSVNVEQGFSRGRLLLTHVRSRLSSQATGALLCLGNWSLRGYINDSDLQVAALMADVEGAEEELEEQWDKILL